MRSLSIGVIVYICLIVAVIFCGPLSNAASAQPGLVLGVVVGEDSLVNSSKHGQQLSEYLEKSLSVPVKLRSFTTQDQLYLWLTRYREVDIAWFRKDYLSNVPPGELFTLTSNISSMQAAAPGEFVANQGVDAALRSRLEKIFLAMDESPSGRQLLAELGVRQDPALLPQPPAQAVEATEPSAVVAEAPTAEVPESVVAPVAVQEDAASPVSSEVEPAVPTSAPADEEPIELVADYLAYNAAEDLYEAKGDVVLRREGVELKSDQLLWQAATQDASASGSITLQDAGAQVSGENLQYNLATGEGQVQQGKVFIREGNFHLAGEEIERHGHADYLVRNGSFTTCDGEIPDWKFTAEEVDVTLGGYATAKNVFFHIKDIPVLYTPYLFFPVKTERESGLLTPWLGYSNNKGVRASLAWYQVIDRHMDATFYLDYLSEIALGKGLEYRYALANQNNGEALYYHVTGFSDVPDMYHVEWRHRGDLPAQWRLTADIDYTDKKMFYDEFGEVAEDYNRDKSVSTVVLQRNWQKLNLVAHGRYIKDLEVEDNDAVLQRLPELGLALSSYRLGATPVYLELESYATRFWRKDGEDGDRLYLKPSLSAVLTPGSWLEIAPEIALHGRLYDTDVSNENEFIPEFNLIMATRLQKSFAFERWGYDRMQHSIEPKVRYVYVPEENQADLPEFDLLDRIEPRNEIEYALINRLTVRSVNSEGVKNYRDFMYLRLSQAYDIDEARNNTSGNDQPFSDVRVEFDFSPTPNLTLDTESLIPVYGATRFRTARAGVLAKDDSGNAVEIDYNYKDEEFAEAANDYLRLRLDTALFKPLYLRLEDRYDFRESRELERTVGLEYRAKCWSLLLTYRNRYREEGGNDHEVMVNFVLAGLGQNKGFGNSFGSVADR